MNYKVFRFLQKQVKTLPKAMSTGMFYKLTFVCILLAFLEEVRPVLQSIFTCNLIFLGQIISINCFDGKMAVMNNMAQVQMLNAKQNTSN